MMLPIRQLSFCIPTSFQIMIVCGAIGFEPEIVSSFPYQLNRFVYLLCDLNCFNCIITAKPSSESATDQAKVNLNVLLRNITIFSDSVHCPVRQLQSTPDLTFTVFDFRNAIHGFNCSMGEQWSGISCR